MATDTSIGWTTKTLNPGVYGCEADGKECRACYAEVMAWRQENMARKRGETEGGYIGVTRNTALGPKFNGVVRVERDRVAPAFASLPKAGCAVFVTSMADLFHDDVPFDFIDLVFEHMEALPQHWFQVLTKRTKNARRFAWATGRAAGRWPKHIWLGATWGDPAKEHRVRDLLEVPAPNLFLSMEPLLGPITPRASLGVAGEGDGRIRWVIAGGESGRDPVPSHPDWFRAIRDDAGERDTTFFFKQWGHYKPAADLTNAERAGLGEHHYRQVHHGAPGRGSVLMAGLGTSRTGAVLDGVEHLHFPAGWSA